MPYIEKKDRDGLQYDSSECSRRDPVGPGELNYSLTTTINTYLHSKPLSYQVINDIVGALEGAKLEFYRRVAVPYENEKKDKNGDVY